MHAASSAAIQVGTRPRARGEPGCSPSTACREEASGRPHPGRGRRRDVGQPAPGAVRRALRGRARCGPPPGRSSVSRSSGSHCESGDVAGPGRRAPGGSRAGGPPGVRGDRRLHLPAVVGVQPLRAPGRGGRPPLGGDRVVPTRDQRGHGPARRHTWVAVGRRERTHRGRRRTDVDGTRDPASGCWAAARSVRPWRGPCPPARRRHRAPRGLPPGDRRAWPFATSSAIVTSRWPPEVFTADADSIVDDPDIDVVVRAARRHRARALADPARLRARQAGRDREQGAARHVGTELFDAAATRPASTCSSRPPSPAASR